MNNPAAIFGFPFPDPLYKGVPAETVPVNAFGSNLSFNNVLGSDAGMVHAGTHSTL
jgi:hypothetical protein